MEILQRIQQMQFTQRAEAEHLLTQFIGERFGMPAQRVELRPLAVSLNSFNGFVTFADGRRLFFKTHTEQDNVIDEYYNARALAEAGYPVIQPVFSSTQAGQHLLMYEVIDDPSVFDVAWEIEQGQGVDQLAALTAAQQQADDRLFGLYARTLGDQPAVEAFHAPIHQLFYHRLTGGRLERFYGAEVTLDLPGRVGVSMAEVRRVRWEINGQRYEVTLDDLIAQAIQLLDPLAVTVIPSVIGHGDAHNGNVFFRADGLMYFDPAFAGRHHPLLDLTKPLFHNVFAMWMYFPQVKQAQTPIRLVASGDVWRVEYEYPLPEVRRMFWQSKVERVLRPTVDLLARRGQLRADWKAFLKVALLCCPLLTLNLADPMRFPPEISLLGLAMAVEMGAASYGERSLVDRALDEVE